MSSTSKCSNSKSPKESTTFLTTPVLRGYTGKTVLERLFGLIHKALSYKHADLLLEFFKGLFSLVVFFTVWQALQTHKLQQERLVTDRFSKAIEQLAQKEKTASIAGIYTLEAIANNNDKEHRKVMEVLTIYVLGKQKSVKSEKSKELEIDVQVALTAIGRLNKNRQTDKGIDNSIDLFRANLERANLEGAHLWFANLERANLEGADLKKANLERANLERANLEGAHLWFANLQDAKLLYANLEGAHLYEAILNSADLYEANLQRARLAKAKLEDAELLYANLQDANLQDANLQDANLKRAELERAHLYKANLEKAALESTNLQDANLQQANFKRANLKRADLAGADLSGADLFAANLSGADLFAANLSGADLSGAKLKDANLKSTDLSNANLIEVENLTDFQIKSACYWEKAYYKGEWYWEQKNRTWVANSEQDKQKNINYIKDLMKDKKTDPTTKPDCSSWEK